MILNLSSDIIPSYPITHIIIPNDHILSSDTILSRPEPNTRVGYVMAAHSLEQALKNMQGQIKSLQSYQP